MNEENFYQQVLRLRRSDQVDLPAEELAAAEMNWPMLAALPGTQALHASRIA